LLCGFMTHAVDGTSIPISTLTPMLGLDDDASSLESLLKHTRIAPEDVLEVNWKSEPFSPGHYVAYDRELRSVVVSIRGTWGVKDSVTDLVAFGMPFAFAGVEGFVHEGVYRCAAKKAEALEKLLVASAQSDRVLVTGHSLGGGVATVLALLLAQKHPEWDIVCFAFAPAASLTRQLAEAPAVRAIVHSFVFRDDLVPRLSYGSLELLKRTIQKLLTQSTTYSQRIFQMVASGNVLGDSLT
jgi:pimeloyl-ACP methyl ester carboxylesterase